MARKFNGPRDLLAASLTTGALFDVMFLAFTRRDSLTGSLLGPEPIYATVRVLQDAGVNVTSDEGSMWMQVSPGNTPSCVDTCEEDSDIDEDEPQILEELVPEPSDARTPPVHHFDCATEERWSNNSCGPPYPGHIRKVLDGSHVHNFPTYFVTMASHRTWRAFVYYCYTKEANFAPLTSMGSQTDARAPSHTPLCSPKSMYHLAMKLDIPALAEAAFHDFRSKLSAKNILDESLSKFAAAHPRVREAATNILLKHRYAPEVLQPLQAQVEKMLRGEMPHVQPVLLALLCIPPMSSPTSRSFWFNGLLPQSLPRSTPAERRLSTMRADDDEKVDGAFADQLETEDVAAASIANVAVELTTTNKSAKPLLDLDITAQEAETSQTETENDDEHHDHNNDAMTKTEPEIPVVEMEMPADSEKKKKRKKSKVKRKEEAKGLEVQEPGADVPMEVF